MTVFSFNFNSMSMNSYERGRFQNWVVWFCRKCVFTISTWSETHLSCKIRCHLNVCMQQVTLISPCYYDCHIGCCISCSCSCSQRFSSFISLATLNLNDQWTETRDRAGWAESECEHLAPRARARGKWVVSSVSVRVQSKEQHMRELLYPIIATFYYAKRILHVVCAVVGSEIMSWRDARDSWTPDIACDDLDLDSSPNYLSSGRVY